MKTSRVPWTTSGETENLRKTHPGRRKMLLDAIRKIDGLSNMYFTEITGKTLSFQRLTPGRRHTDPHFLLGLPNSTFCQAIADFAHQIGLDER